MSTVPSDLEPSGPTAPAPQTAPAVASAPDAAPATASGPEPGPAGSGSAQPRHEAAGKRRRSGPLSWLTETVVIVASALVLSLIIKTFFVQSFYIPSPSMNDTLLEGDRVMVNKLVPTVFSVHRGDIVVFKDPGNWLNEARPPAPTGVTRVVDDVLTFVGLLPQDAGEHLIKRVIGVSGDEVACCTEAGKVTVNGVAIDEPYLKPGVRPSEVTFDIVVPDGYLWVMGDNRINSGDSRYHQGEPGGGAIPVDNVVGVAFIRTWPADRFGILHNPGATFATVP